MAIAYTSTYYNEAGVYPPNGTATYTWSYSVTNTSGNAFCLFGSLDLSGSTWSEINSAVTSITYGGASATIDFQEDYDWSGGGYGAKVRKYGAHLLNAPTGPNNLVIQCNQDGAWGIYARVAFVSGPAISGTVAYAQQSFSYPEDDQNHISTLSVPSTTGGLTIGFGYAGGDSQWNANGLSGTPTPTNIVAIGLPFPLNSYTGTTPNITMSSSIYSDSELYWGSAGVTLAGFSFSPSSTPTSSYTKYNTGSHIGPWTIGTVLKTTGAGTRNMGAASVVQFIPLAAGSAVTCMLPAGAQILNAYTYMTTGDAGTPNLTINGTVVGTISTVAGRNALSVTASAVGTLNNVGTSDVIASYTATAATDGYLVIHYVVRNKDGSTAPLIYTSTQSV